MKNKLKRVEIMQVDEKYYFTMSTASVYMDLHPNTLRKFIDKGLIKAKILPNGNRWCSKASLDNFWNSLPDALDTVRESSYNPSQSDLSLTPRKGD